MATLAQAIQAIQALPAKILDEQRKAEAQTMEKHLIRAVELSLGPFSQSQLNDLGNPYATKHGAPQLDPSVINVQTGHFAGSWQMAQGGWTKGELSSTVFNFSREADFLQPGTSKMFARPIDVRVVTELASMRLDALNRATDRALRAFKP